MSSLTRYRCAVVTPVGPGHETLCEQCQDSVVRSFSEAKGLFSEVVLIQVDDSQGLSGRSRCRNTGVRAAVEQQVDWIFFLDADDLMAPQAFALASPYLLKYDAVWGLIYSFDHNCSRPIERPGQLKTINDVTDLLGADPFLTLQMGHFVRTRVALTTPFDPCLDSGEDFDYYLRVWAKYRGVKTPHPFFFNRRGLHSTGPKSADGRQWRMAVEERMIHYARQWGLPLAGQYPVQERAAG